VGEGPGSTVGEGSVDEFIVVVMVSVVVGVTIVPVGVGGVPVKVGVTEVDDGVHDLDDKLVVEVIFVIDDDTVASVVGGGCDSSLPQPTTYNIDAATIGTAATSPALFIALPVNTPVNTIAPPAHRYGQSDIDIAAH